MTLSPATKPVHRPGEFRLPFLALPFLTLLFSLACALTWGQRPADPPPYAPIANPLPDTLDQLYRDSLNLKISKIRVNQAGYRTGDRKYFYAVGLSGAFTVLDAAGKTAGSGTLAATGHQTSGQLQIKASNNAQLITGGDTRYQMSGPAVAGDVYEGQLPSLPPGRYRIVVGNDTSAAFEINDGVYGWLKDALLMFYGANRSGENPSWLHPPSHLKDGPGGNGALSGGWYDCGDHLKEGQTMGFAFAMLGLSAAAFPERDADRYGNSHAQTYRTDGIPDILREAKVGADFALKSFDLAKGNPADMITSVGNIGEDHAWWGQPHFQDNMPQSRGGPVRELRNETGANVMGRFASGLALMGKLYAPYDKAYADRCLAAARKIYAFAKGNRVASSSQAYSGESSIYDDMGLAAIALLWATADTSYKFDLLYNRQIGDKGNPAFPKGGFDGGWFAYDNPGPQHGLTNTDWASVQTPALWALYKLALKDKATAASLGIGEEERLRLIEDVIHAIVINIGDLEGGTAGLDLPASSMGWKKNTFKYDPLWKISTFGTEWVYNRYVAGNSTELFCYWDIAKDLQGLSLPNTSAGTDWKAGQAKELLVRQMDYFLGVNPWDLSMVYGVGAKTFNHPHHRGANPEGKNVPGAFYRYRPPVGALQGGQSPAKGLYSEHFDDFKHSEVCLDGTTNILLPTVGLAQEEQPVPLAFSVSIEYVGADRAIVLVRPTRYATSIIRYGTSSASLGGVKPSDSAGMAHRLELTGLKPSTVYYFTVEGTDIRGVSALDDNKGEKYSFTTLGSQGVAQFAQVRACNVTHDGAEILWYTPNGAFDSKVTYGVSKPPTTVQAGDEAGHPVKFHFVKLTGLKERTTYYFQVESGGAKDDNAGKFYSFTTPVRHVDFQVRSLRYEWGGKPALEMNIINNDVTSYDSLELRIYLRGDSAKIARLGARADLGIKYAPGGEQGRHFKTDLDKILQRSRPVRLDDSFDPKDGTYAYYFPVPLDTVRMAEGSRIRVGLIFTNRSPWPPYEDLLDEVPLHPIGAPAGEGGKDWSFIPHSRAQGDPADFGGVKFGSKSEVDDNYWNHEINPYITVYRKGQFVYGYSPSAKEQQNKVTRYQLDLRITSPLNHPPEDRKELDLPSSTVLVRGRAVLRDAQGLAGDGRITDIWVNGERLQDASQAARYDAAAAAYDLTIPVKLSPGGNAVDITLFASAGGECQTCTGCAFANAHFFLEFKKGASTPGRLSLLAADGAPLPDSVQPGITAFLAQVDDKNGDQTSAADTLRVLAFNHNRGDSVWLELVETGPKTGIFRSAIPVLLIDALPAATVAGQMAMGRGDSLIVFYRDPFDSEDSARAFRYLPADFPQAQAGWFFDSDGDGAVDSVAVRFTRPLAAAPDSLALSFPGAGGARMLRSGDLSAQPDLPGASLIAFRIDPALAPGRTAIDAGAVQTAFITYEGTPRAGRFSLGDSAGPVLNRASLAQGELKPSGGSRADTLRLVFSETVRYNSPDPDLLVKRGEGAEEAGAIRLLQLLEISDTVAVFLVDPAFAAGLTGNDSLRLAVVDGSSAFQDGAGNLPHTSNRWVELSWRAAAPPSVLSIAWGKPLYSSEENWDRLPAFLVLAPASGAQPGGPGKWMPVAGGTGGIGSTVRSCDALDCGEGMDADGQGHLQAPAVTVEASRPFRIRMSIYSNLGYAVNSFQADVNQGFPAAGAPSGGGAASPIPEKRFFQVAWNGTSTTGARAGTGAYIFSVTVSDLPSPDARPSPRQSSRRLIGLMRRN